MHSGPGCIRPKMHFARIHSTAECKDPMPGPWATHRPGLCAVPSEPSAASPPPPGLASLGPMSPAHGRVFVDAYICAFECQLRLHDRVDYVHAFACMYVFKCMLCMHALHASCTHACMHACMHACFAYMLLRACMYTRLYVDVRYQISDIRYQMNIRSYISDIRYQMLDILLNRYT
jgi:hypothetical protein